MAGANKAIPTEDVKSVLILKADHLGDLMLAAQAVASIRAAFPDAKFTLASGREGGELYRALSLVDETIQIEGPSIRGNSMFRGLNDIRKIRGEKFDLVVNLRHDFRDIIFASMLKGKYFCSYDHKGLAFNATHKIPAPDPNLYEAQNHLKCVDALKIKAVNWRPPAFSHDESDPRRITGREKIAVIHPSARTPAKQWSVDRFASLAGKLDEAGFGVVCIGSERDGELCGRVINSISDGANLAGRIDFKQMFAVLQRADLFVGVDSFVMHAAAACSVPGVAIFSGTNISARWAPPGIRVVKNPVPCAPCSLENCNVDGHPCLEGITVTMVKDSVNMVVKQLGSA